MAGLSYPTLLPGLFADGAANHDTIPDTGAATGRMAWDVGFPAETSQPTAIGGVPPHRLDMNGLGNRLSQHTLWQQSGGMYMWDATLDYPPYAHVIGSDGKEYIAQAPSGPSQGSGAINPVNDSSFVYWKSLPRIMLDMIYPVGSIYMSVNATNPATLFGGTWSQISGRFILAASGNYPSGSTGGNATKQLQLSEMPVHTHTGTADSYTHNHSVTTTSKTITVNTGSAGAHTHGVTFPSKSITTTTAGAHTHTRGSMDIKGTFSGVGEKYDGVPNTLTGAFYRVNTKKDPSQGVPLSNSGNKDDYFGFEASRNWSGSTSSNGGHSHSITIAATNMTTGSAGSHTHSVSVTVPAQTNDSANNTHTHTLTIAQAGGNASFSLLPPYFAVNVWQRTA